MKYKGIQKVNEMTTSLNHGSRGGSLVTGSILITLMRISMFGLIILKHY